MVFGLFKKKDSLPKRCQRYLETGPPISMTSYVPNSLTEIVIDHGARQVPLDPEFMEIATIILFEEGEINEYQNKDVETYLKQGFALVREVLDAQ